ncbi:hypothetical protein STCU_12056 [Strigomonas culicis]|uniref:Uncharacterized protein n=1 Tax=Strigomonas culicis TaxID=28005 RepID=S9TGB4_9TRYP|nr:hypothetical protein STCU_12056 [Strigomonas culicis]|eukprot:EPY15398.1 hypothetical protein STCU_12056 [Strigomonas culicis]
MWRDGVTVLSAPAWHGGAAGVWDAGPRGVQATFRSYGVSPTRVEGVARPVAAGPQAGGGGVHGRRPSSTIFTGVGCVR